MSQRQHRTERMRGILALLAAAAAFALCLAMPAQALADDAASSQSIYRLFNQWSGEHLFTASKTEYDGLVKIGWNGEGVAWTAPAGGDSPVYRLYNPYSGDHHYTRDRGEYDHLGSLGWNQEGAAFQSAGEDGAPVYRLYNPWLTVGTHLFTTDKAEYDHLGTLGWHQEDIAWYGLKADSPQVVATGAFGKGCTWTLDNQGTLTVSPTDGVSGTMSSLGEAIGGKVNLNDVKAVYIAKGVKAPQDSRFLFADLSLELDASTIDVTNLDISDVTSMAFMFDGCGSLTSIPGLSSWDTSKVTDMSQMFMNDTSLTDLSPLSGWDVSKVTSLNCMFADCGSLHDLSPLSGWRTSSVTDMFSMFSDCTSLADISALKDWNTSSVIIMSQMFMNDTSLTDLSPLSGWDVSKVMDMSGMFYGCSSLSDATALDSWKVGSSTNTSSMFPIGSKMPSWCDPDGTATTGTFGEGCTWTLDNQGTLTVSPTDGVSGTMSSLGEAIAGKVMNDVKAVYIAKGVKAPQNSRSLFSRTVWGSVWPEGVGATTIDVTNLDISDVTSMAYMFCGCKNLTSIPGLSGWDTSKITDMSHMFIGCDSLLDLSSLSGWDVSKVTYMSHMFYGCGSLSDATALETWKVGSSIGTDSMFPFGCKTPSWYKQSE